MTVTCRRPRPPRLGTGMPSLAGTGASHLSAGTAAIGAGVATDVVSRRSCCERIYGRRSAPTSVPISALPTAGSAHTTAIPLTWHQPLGFVGLSILNFLMRIPTVGLYAFWGRTEVRKRIWSGIRLDGEPLQIPAPARS